MPMNVAIAPAPGSATSATTASRSSGPCLDGERAARDRRDDRDLVAGRELVAAPCVLAVSGVGQPGRLVSQLEPRPHVGDGRAVGDVQLALRPAGPLTQRGEEPDGDPHAGQRTGSRRSGLGPRSIVPAMTKPVYGPDDAPGVRPPPGEFPFTRGARPEGYRGRPWTMRQYAGFVVGRGDERALPAAARPRPDGPLGRVRPADPARARLRRPARAAARSGARASPSTRSADMRTLLDGIPLGEVSTSMTINAPASLLLLLYELVAEEQGVDAEALCAGRSRTTSSRSTSPAATTSSRPRPSHAADRRHVPATAPSGCRASTRSRSPGYHIREAGSTRGAGARVHARQRHRLRAGGGRRRASRWTRSRVRLSFFFNAHNDFFQEVASFALRGMLWAEIMRSRFGATRRATPDAAVSRPDRRLDADCPAGREQHRAGGGAGVSRRSCGGAQSLPTNGFDEALALPTERSRHDRPAHAADPGEPRPASTQTTDPLAGSYYIEALTDELANTGARADHRDRRARRRRRSGRVWLGAGRQIEQGRVRTHHQRVQSGDAGGSSASTAGRPGAPRK